MREGGVKERRGANMREGGVKERRDTEGENNREGKIKIERRDTKGEIKRERGRCERGDTDRERGYARRV
jgi:hypothetical protein